MKKLYFGGSLLTMDRTNPRAEAVLTEDGKILAVGTYADLRDDAAEEIHLNGATLMPAFVDGHSHMYSTGEALTRNCSLDGCTCFDEILERIRQFRQSRQLFDRQPICARGYDVAILKENKQPTGRLLDQLGFSNPICCIHISGHMACYNRAAMEAAGVRDEDYVCPPGGFAGRDEDGTLNGYFEENAKAPFAPVFNATVSDEAAEQAILAAQDYYIRHGFTTIQDGSANRADRIRLYERLANEGKLKVDVVLYLSAVPAEAPMWEEALSRIGRSYRNNLKIGGVKLFLDGSPQAKTAWLSEPYEGETEYRGYPTLTAEETEARLQKAVEYGLQPLAHCNGDAASEQFLNAWETVTAGKDVGDLRPVMIHSQTVRTDQLDRMVPLRMMPSFFIGHCYFWGDTHLQNLGDRGTRISPAARALERNMVFSFHQDSPITPPDMLHSVWCAVNRVTRSGVCVGPDNRLDCYEALIAATQGGAYSYFEEEMKGILKAGAAADFVILEQDPTAVDPMSIKDIRILATIRADQVIYQADEAT